MKHSAFKLTLIALTGLLSISSLQAFVPQEGKEYFTIRQAPSAQKEVIEFFSFYCPHCYEFEKTHQIPTQIKQKLDKSVKFYQYHVNFLGSQSENLTQAWALAMMLNVEDKVKLPLFEAVRSNSIKSMDDIRTIFIQNGITAAQFDGGINSFSVKASANKQHQLAQEYKVMGVPAFFINGQYQINVEGFSDVNSLHEFVERYIDSVVSLTQH